MTYENDSASSRSENHKAKEVIPFACMEIALFFFDKQQPLDILSQLNIDKIIHFFFLTPGQIFCFSFIFVITN